ncbi:hypothetical protein M9H77_06700 [Catharanthus roseus]|uniref:Uncharacterized protein n=1 Tax=Catharanthus roseus TaxID=4058 RepID=A0ACC0BT00_CATRO|nr:hypothetical protein M9H77_06700 [Catharanthus roseus]
MQAQQLGHTYSLTPKKLFSTFLLIITRLKFRQIMVQTSIYFLQQVVSELQLGSPAPATINDSRSEGTVEFLRSSQYGLSLSNVKNALKSIDLDLQKENKSHSENLFAKIFLYEEELTEGNLLVIVLKVKGDPNHESKTKFDSFMLKIGFSKSNYNSCLYYSGTNIDSTIYLLLYHNFSTAALLSFRPPATAGSSESFLIDPCSLYV